jgi:hypothetical protein
MSSEEEEVKSEIGCLPARQLFEARLKCVVGILPPEINERQQPNSIRNVKFFAERACVAFHNNIFSQLT